MAVEDPTRTLNIPQGSHGQGAPSLRVVIVAGGSAGPTPAAAAATGTAASSKIVVGRGEGADLRVVDPTISQFHVELTPEVDGVLVRDLKSRNGTRAANIAIREAVVEYGAELTLGGTTIRLERGDDVKREPRSKHTSFGGLVGSSDVMRDLYGVLERLAPTQLSVLIEGQTGTGKEVAARALHDHGRNPSGPFIVVDCTTIPPGLAESILFGHEKGAFTGATEKRMGLLEAATGGTVFLDELGDLPRDLQPKLLGALERREITPVGSNKSRSIDVRVISATLRDLRAMVNRGEFREDLYYRAAQARVVMPSLADRPDDIRALVQHFLGAIHWDVPAARAISPEALDLFAHRPFLGNVRELKSAVERVAMIAAGPSITEADLAFERILVVHDRDQKQNKGGLEPSSSPSPRAPAEGIAGEIEPFKEAKRTAIDEFEHGYLERLLQKTGLNISRAAGVAGVERQTLRELLRKHGLHSVDR